METPFLSGLGFPVAQRSRLGRYGPNPQDWITVALGRWLKGLKNVSYIKQKFEKNSKILKMNRI
jgi:hypothetical protein